MRKIIGIIAFALFMVLYLLLPKHNKSNQNQAYYSDFQPQAKIEQNNNYLQQTR
jgi:cbb3-type cytochrome oxidase subunit 3